MKGRNQSRKQKTSPQEAGNDVGKREKREGLVTYDGSVSALQVGLVVDVDDGWKQILEGGKSREMAEDETLFNLGHRFPNNNN